MFRAALLDADLVDQFEQLALRVGDRLESFPFKLETRPPLGLLFIVERLYFHYSF